jgi:hypothetical protein
VTSVVVPPADRRWHRIALQVAFLLSLAGLGVSAWAHVLSLAGIDPGSLFRSFWLFQLILFGLLMPIIIELFHPQPAGGVLRSPRWMRMCLFALLGYYGANFYYFLYWSTNHLNAAATWRMFSAGWLLLFATAVVYYRVRYLEAKPGG